MPVHELAQRLGLFAVQVVILYGLSRVLFMWVLRSAACTPGGLEKVLRALRLPGNLIHEVGHAIGYRLFGYRVKRIVSCREDPEGCGICTPGEPWSPIAIPWLATAGAAVMPLLFGTLVLWGWAEALEMPLGEIHAEAHEGVLLYLWDTLRLSLFALDFTTWRTWAFLYIAFTIGAELAPSSADLRQGLVPLLLICGVASALVLWTGYRHPDSAAWPVFRDGVASVLRLLQPLFSFGIVTTGIVAAITALPALLLRTVRMLTAP